MLIYIILLYFNLFLYILERFTNYEFIKFFYEHLDYLFFIFSYQICYFYDTASNIIKMKIV
jgi:hypothetical protein